MTVSYGFYNSVGGDRQYTAEQMSEIFTGVINDGIFENIEAAMKVNWVSGMTVSVGKGRAWFNNTWTKNDATLAVLLDNSEVTLDRIDAIILEVDSSSGVRANSIKFKKGTPGSSPVAPTMTNTSTLHQYALAYISVPHGVTSVSGLITDNRGTVSCPFAVSADQLYAQLIALEDQIASAVTVDLKGLIAYVPFSSAPSGWLKANGAAVSRTTYSALFSAIGTTFGVGDGSTTFNLPDMRGVFPRGLDDGKGYDTGRSLGSYQADDNKAHTHTGTTASDGAHTHTVDIQSSAGYNTKAAYYDSGNTTRQYTTSSGGSHTHTFTTGSTGATEVKVKNVALLAIIRY